MSNLVGLGRKVVTWYYDCDAIDLWCFIRVLHYNYLPVLVVIDEAKLDMVRGMVQRFCTADGNSLRVRDCVLTVSDIRSANVINQRELCSLQKGEGERSSPTTRSAAPARSALDIGDRSAISVVQERLGLPVHNVCSLSDLYIINEDNRQNDLDRVMNDLALWQDDCNPLGLMSQPLAEEETLWSWVWPCDSKNVPGDVVGKANNIPTLSQASDLWRVCGNCPECASICQHWHRIYETVGQPAQAPQRLPKPRCPLIPETCDS